jgi:hypothetical protein
MYYIYNCFTLVKIEHKLWGILLIPYEMRNQVLILKL